MARRRNATAEQQLRVATGIDNLNPGIKDFVISPGELGRPERGAQRFDILLWLLSGVHGPAVYMAEKSPQPMAYCGNPS